MANSSRLWSRLSMPASSHDSGQLMLHRFGFSDLAADVTIAARIDLLAEPMHAWTRDEITQAWFRDQCSGQIATLDGVPAGYLLHRYNGRTVELARIAVVAPLQRHGVGRRLVDAMLCAMEDGRRTSVTARVPLANLPACHFLAACEFESRLAEFSGSEEIVGFTSRPRCSGK